MGVSALEALGLGLIPAQSSDPPKNISTEEGESNKLGVRLSSFLHAGCTTHRAEAAATVAAASIKLRGEHTGLTANMIGNSNHA